MGRNNTLFRLYQEIVDGYVHGEDGLFEHGVRCLMETYAESPDSPFGYDSEENELLFQAYQGYIRWKNHGADMKVNRRRMIAAMKQLCAKCAVNPYVFSEEEDKEDKRILEEQQREIERQKEQEKLRELEKQKELERQKELEEKKEEEKQHVLGVLPENKKHKRRKMFSRNKEGESHDGT